MPFVCQSLKGVGRDSWPVEQSQDCPRLRAAYHAYLVHTHSVRPMRNYCRVLRDVNAVVTVALARSWSVTYGFNHPIETVFYLAGLCSVMHPEAL